MLTLSSLFSLGSNPLDGTSCTLETPSQTTPKVFFFHDDFRSGQVDNADKPLQAISITGSYPHHIKMQGVTFQSLQPGYMSLAN